MADTEGTFPKIDGYHLWASEVNSFNKISGTTHTSENGPYSHTGDTEWTTVRTYTLGGGFSGNILVFLTFDLTGDAGGGNARIVTNTKEINDYSYPTASWDSNFYATTTARGCSLMVTVQNTDTINIQVRCPSAPSTVSISSIRIFCGNTVATFTGS